MYYSNELYHHGVKGQKWGVRRYQYENGSLTDEGYRHYGYGKGARTAGDAIGASASKGAKIGAKVGAGFGATIGGIGALAFGSVSSAAGPAGIAAMGAAYLVGGAASGALAGAWDGLRIGAIVGGVEYASGRRYIQKHLSEDLTKFQEKELKKYGSY